MHALLLLFAGTPEGWDCWLLASMEIVLFVVQVWCARHCSITLFVEHLLDPRKSGEKAL